MMMIDQITKLTFAADDLTFSARHFAFSVNPFTACLCVLCEGRLVANVYIYRDEMRGV